MKLLTAIAPRKTRRGFLKTGMQISAAGVLATGSLSNAFATSTNGYEIIQTPIATRDASRVEVLEFFWFACPHCYALEPAISQWSQNRPEYVDFVREAPPLNRSWEQQSRAFYAAEALGVIDGFLDPMFNAIHKERQPMRDPGKIAKLAEKLDLGVSAEAFRTAMQSADVEVSMQRSVQLAMSAGITGVPSIIINGKYRTGGALAGSNERIVEIINSIIADEHAAS
ncbi:MAG: thiol:disulfide interchange protein DsbA/DsbL [Granulosicoccus sp.]